jgi:type IV pilus assembly protein PilX
MKHFSESPLRLAASMPQRGIALIIGLVILAVLSMIGVAAFSISTQEERMAGNSRDRMVAFEAAEAALRACEDYVQTGPAFNGSVSGMYAAPPSTQKTMAESIDWNTPANVYIDSHLTLSANAGHWSKAPACVAEQFLVQHGNPRLGEPLIMVPTIHITTQGYGLNRATIVRLESYYAP